MNAVSGRNDDADSAPPLYAVIDRRADGGRRIVSEHIEPAHAANVAEMLRRYGADARVQLVAREDAA